MAPHDKDDTEAYRSSGVQRGWMAMGAVRGQHE